MQLPQFKYTIQLAGKMAHVGGGDTKSPQKWLHMLCSKITGLENEALVPYFRIALSTVVSNISCPSENDEFEIAEKIKRKLARNGKEKDAAIFSDLHRKLQAKDLLKNRLAILSLLHRLSEDKSKQNKSVVHPSFMRGLSSNLMSTPLNGNTASSGAFDGSSGTLGKSGLSAGSSAYGTINSQNRNDSTITPMTLHPGQVNTPYTPFHHAGQNPSINTQQTGLRLANLYSSSSGQTISTIRSDATSLALMSNKKLRKDNKENTQFELPESTLVREIVFIFQGIEGEYIKFEVAKEAFRIDPKIGIPRAFRKEVAKLAECGWLYNKVRKYTDSRSTDRAFGLVGQSFCAALHQQLTEYYRLMAVLEAQLRQEEDQGVSISGPGLTLRRLAVWTWDPLVRLKAMAALVDICQGKKGGALASAIHSYIRHGDPSIRALVKHILTLVGQPIFTTIMRWQYDGDLEDTYHEFFVASDPTVKDDRLWHDKYSLRKSMIPSFINHEQAKKILLTGKSINFLRQVCHDRATIRNRDVVKHAETNKVESIFMQDMDGVFQNMIDAVYKETSRHLLEVLHNKYNFMDHLKAMRRYLLLGQGDFIRHLMDLLEEDLAKPAQSLFLHNLTGILETAIRATNAQFDEQDILKRLDVRLLEVSPGDTGWDVFSLDYHVDGPMRTVFTPECMIMYLRVFNFLWRAKRMEYILAALWKEQMSHTKLLRSIPELGPVLHQGHIITSQMVHFVQQVQYYINFEVLECSWDDLLQKVETAEDLDHIIAAHEEFLDTVISRSLLDNQSSDILTQLRAIFDLIIQFQSIQDNMYLAATEELAARLCFEEKAKVNTDKGKWGKTDVQEKEEDRRRLEFVQSMVPTTRSQLRVLAQSYQNMVQQFLVMLTGHSDLSLRFLSFRLDFNEVYKSKEPKLRSPMAYQKSKKRI